MSYDFFTCLFFSLEHHWRDTPCWHSHYVYTHKKKIVFLYYQLFAPMSLFWPVYTTKNTIIK